MSTKTTISLVIFSAILLSACTAKAPTGTQNQAGEAGTEQTQKSTLRDLLALGKNQKCDISVTDNSDGTKVETKATLYVSGKKMSEDITITSTDENIPSSKMRMISDGTYTYTWNTETKASGMKFKLTEPEKENTPSDNDKSQTSGVNMDQKYDMKCSPWIVNNSVFTVPSDVQFTDLSELMKNIPTVPAIPEK